MKTCSLISKLVLSGDPNLTFIFGDEEFEAIDVDYNSTDNVVSLSRKEEPDSAETIMLRCNELAVEFYKLNGYEAYEYKGAMLFESNHPQERLMWAMAEKAFETLYGYEMTDIMSEYLTERET